MRAYKSFAVTKPGGSHVKNNIPCQDDSFCADYKKDTVVSIAVVADGHGDGNCFRSDVGANFAVQCAKSGIYNFVKDHEELFKPGKAKKSPPPSRKDLEKALFEKLITYTVRSWNKWVWEHYEKNPFTPPELEKASEKYRARYENGANISKAYGTSLIAAAITPHYWFGFHIGDGRLTVLTLDGKSQQPVPWDPECYLNVTTSICDDNVLTREFGVRKFLSLNAETPPPVAVFLCTDGVDDNYPVEGNEKHLFKLYRTIAMTFAKESFDSTCEQLEGLANAFATKGKGDDTSIAGFVDAKALKKMAPVWQKQIVREETEAAKKPAEVEGKETAASQNAQESIAAYKKQMNFAKGGLLKKITLAICLVLAGCVIGFSLTWFVLRERELVVDVDVAPEYQLVIPPLPREPDPAEHATPEGTGIADGGAAGFDPSDPETAPETDQDITGDAEIPETPGETENQIL